MSEMIDLTMNNAETVSNEFPCMSITQYAI